MRRPAVVWTCSLLLLAGCGGSDEPATPDAPRADAAVADAQALDSPTPDAALPVTCPDWDDTAPPAACTPCVSSTLAAHVEAMRTAGWASINAANVAMVDIGDAPLAGSGAWTVPGAGTLRELTSYAYDSEYLTRSSPDGRFVAHGAKLSSHGWVHDLESGTSVDVAASYDPAFFPDNAGFEFAGGNQNLCSTSVLTSLPPAVTMNELSCANISALGLQPSLAAATDLSGYVALSGDFENDLANSDVVVNPSARFTSTSAAKWVPLIWDGTKFVASAFTTVNLPFQGDSELSPSAQLVISRVAGSDDNQNGYAIRRFENGAAPVLVGRLCGEGGKATISYDERWAVYHHYVENTDADATELGFTSETDAGFASYVTNGAANIYLVDLSTGATTRITNMPAGYFAVSPHFRSDGWIYFEVRQRGVTGGAIIASDAARVP